MEEHARVICVCIVFFLFMIWNVLGKVVSELRDILKELKKGRR